jgi:hypothetical protein
MKAAAPRTPAPATAPRRGRITRPGDALERDADRMADAALAATPLAATATAAPDAVMRQVAAAGPEFDDDDDFDLAAAARPGGPAPAPHGFLDAVRSSGGGHGLAATQQARFEEGFGRPLDNVRIHDDAPAARLADTVNARAFTHGTHVFFAHGEHRPGPDGDRLLAHELAHTLQRPGAGTIARQPKSRPFDPSTMSDAEKTKLRARIRENARTVTDKMLKLFRKSPRIDAAKKATWIGALDAAIAAGGAITDEHQRTVRLRRLKAERGLFQTSPFYAWLITSGRIEVTTPVAKMGDPAVTASAEALASLDLEADAMQAGGEAYLTWFVESQIYGAWDLRPEDLETAKAAPGGGTKAAGGKAGGAGKADSGTGEHEGPGGTPGPTNAPATEPSDVAGGGKEDERDIRQELFDALGDLAVDAGLGTPDELVAALAKMKQEDRKDFYAFAREMVASSKGGDVKTLLDLVAVFNGLDSASREALTVNRKLTEAQPGGAEGLPKSVLLDIKAQAAAGAEMAQNVAKINNNLDLIKSLTRDPKVRDRLVNIDLGLFHAEIAMIRGLLAGGGNASPLVKEVSDALMEEIGGLADDLQRQLRNMLLESAAASFFAVITEGAASPALVLLLERIRKVKALLDALRRGYRAYERVTEVIDLVTRLGSEYDKFVGWYHRAADIYEKLSAELTKIESADDIAEALETELERLFGELETMLEGKLGELLEMVYIPADTSYDELREIIFNIPEGLTALGDMWSYYRNGSADPKYEETLGIKAFHAGARLFPFVGLIAALVAKGLQAAFSGSTISDRVKGLFEKREGGGKIGSILEDDKASAGERRKRHRGLFGRLLGRRADYDPDSLGPVLDDAASRLSIALDKEETAEDEPSHHWAPAWFRAEVRESIADINKRYHAEKKTTLGSDKQTQVPVPRLHARVIKDGHTLTAEISGSSPKRRVPRQEYTNADFQGKGVRVTGGGPRRQAAIRAWLRHTGYHIDRYKGVDYIRLPGAHPETRERSYLRVAGSYIKAGIDKAAWKDFIGRVIYDSDDLPEGYHLRQDPHAVTVSLKSGLAEAEYQPLGLETGQKLTDKPAKAPPQTIAKPGVRTPSLEPLDDENAPIETMFAPRRPGDPVYNLQGRDKASWTRLVARESELKQRPVAVTGRLGYIVRARGGDRPDTPELRTVDDRGHMIARRFGGEDNHGNIVPMLTAVNQSPGPWYELEAEMADVYTKHPQPGYVDFELSIAYPRGRRRTRRPTSFTARYREWNPQTNTLGPWTSRRRYDND